MGKACHGQRRATTDAEISGWRKSNYKRASWSYTMEVILKEDVAQLGSRGDVVKVAEGYGRNFLLPKKLAIEASKGNKAVIEQMKAAAVRRSANEKAQAEDL